MYVRALQIVIALTLILVSMIVPAALAAEDAQDAAPAFDYAPYAKALSAHVNEKGDVDYKSLKKSRGELDQTVKQLAVLDRRTFEAWPEQQQIALLINAYNVFTLRLIIDNYPIKAGFFASFAYPKNSIRQIDGAWDEKKFNLMGKRVTLEHIEHEMLRKDYNEPRLHMAINCASVGCPPLLDEPFIGAKLDSQLEQQSKAFLSNTAKFKIVRKGKDVYLSPIFKWFGEDFVKTYTPSSGFEGHSKPIRAVLNFISNHVDEDDAKWLRDTRYDTSWLDYDWTLNEQ